MKDKRKDEIVKGLYSNLKPNIADYVEIHAKKMPDETAIIEYNTEEIVSWKRFNTSVNAFAAKLLSIGIKKGDIVATSLPLLKEHIYLMFACFKIGAIIAPLDLRLRKKEIKYSLDKIKPSIYFFLGKTPLMDFSKMTEEIMPECPYIKHWVEFIREGEPIKGAVSIKDFVKDIKWQYIKSLLTGSVKRARGEVDKRDPCLIIFTTGSTGSPKPALICHENILIQNIGLRVAFEMTEKDVMLVNLPPSHVGCVTEQLITTIYTGAKAVILHIFDAAKSLDAIERYKVTILGQIPALYNMEWRLSKYKETNLSSLRFAIYGGQAVSKEFLVKMKEMAPRIGTGLGLTETAGFCTYTDANADVDELAQGIGYDMPITPISIREQMKADGSAGDLKGPGEVGEICFSGPQIFLGYLGDEESTRKTISKDGVCYTGDLGYYDEKGLHFVGRAKLVIKPKGYQVYPEDIENHIMEKLKDKISAVACVGAEHAIYSEAIIAFVEAKEGIHISESDVQNACTDIASYSRPSYVVILKPGELPLNRVAKTDYVKLKETAKDLVSKLRAENKWDR
ncbi:MAG: class I adenylate-forming enzyme family protein [Myxococcota bacterium]